MLFVAGEGVRRAVAQVTLDEVGLDPTKRSLDASNLRDDVRTPTVVLDHLLQTPHLALDPLQPRHTPPTLLSSDVSGAPVWVSRSGGHLFCHAQVSLLGGGSDWNKLDNTTLTELSAIRALATMGVRVKPNPARAPAATGRQTAL